MRGPPVGSEPFVEALEGFLSVIECRDLYRTREDYDASLMREAAHARHALSEHAPGSRFAASSDEPCPKCDRDAFGPMEGVNPVDSEYAERGEVGKLAAALVLAVLVVWILSLLYTRCCA